MALLTVRAAAGQLGVAYSTLKRWVHTGRVRTTRTEGGHHRVAQAEIDRLQAHGIATTTLQASQTIQVEEFRLEGIEPAAQPFQNRTERTLRGAWAAADRELPAGTIRVDLTQPLGRLAFYLIEPRSDDGLANWNLVDGLEADAKVYPIVRTRN